MKGELPEKLRKIRVLNNFSQEYVAEHIEVSLSSYARYEAGKVDIDFYSVYKLANLYKLTIDALVHFGEKDFSISEPTEDYRKTKINIVVQLDGQNDTLDFWVKRLKSINEVI